MSRVKGTVTWFSDTKGYGFAEANGYADIFLHYTAIQGDGFKTLVEGQSIEFDMIQGPKSLMASNVVVIKS